MTLAQTTDADFARDVLQSSVPVLVEFNGTWCAACRKVEPVLEAIAESEAGRVAIVGLNADDNPQLAIRYGVLGLPTLALFVDGEVVHQSVGARPRAVIMRDLEPHLTAAASRR